jgi:hypothetical protein
MWRHIVDCVLQTNEVCILVKQRGTYTLEGLSIKTVRFRIVDTGIISIKRMLKKPIPWAL